MIIKINILCIPFALCMALCGCNSKYIVTSNPPGADVYFGPEEEILYNLTRRKANKSKSIVSHSGGTLSSRLSKNSGKRDDGVEHKYVTPLEDLYGKTGYWQVRKEGYVVPKARFVEYTGKDLALHFDLEPLPESSSRLPAIAQFSQNKSTVNLPERTWSRQNVAVAELGAYSLTEDEGKIVSERIHSALVLTDYFNIVSRSNMALVLEEQNFQKTGHCDLTECLVEMGKVLAVEKIIGGSVGKIGTTYAISLSLVDVETGKSEFTVDAEYKGAADGLLDLARYAVSEISKQYAENKNK